MNDLAFKFVPKDFFFDRDRVARAVGAAQVKVLSKIGAFIRAGAQRSMRRRKAYSEPGSPPSVHSGELKRLIYFAYDPSSRSVVVGPLGFKKSIVPELMEYGGTMVNERSRPIRVRGGGAKKWRFRRKGEVLRYAPRPFMRPALDAEKPKIEKLWANSVKG